MTGSGVDGVTVTLVSFRHPAGTKNSATLYSNLEGMAGALFQADILLVVDVAIQVHDQVLRPANEL